MLIIFGRYFLVWVVAVVSLLLATAVLPGFKIDTDEPQWWIAVLRLPLYFALLLIILRPLLLFLTLPLNGLTLGIPTLLYNGSVLFVAVQAERVIEITNYGQAFLGALIMTIISTGLSSVLRLDEAYPFFQSTIYRLGKLYGPKTEDPPSRGLLILQVDGLSLPSLRRVLWKGRMSTVSAMLAKGSHRLFGWQCGVPSNTPAVQAGFMYGTRENVAGYRWFDRQSQTLRVVSKPKDLRHLESMVADGADPLLKDGSCINSILSGGAAKRLLTISALGVPDRDRLAGEKADRNLFFLSPNAYTKTVLAGIWDYLSGLSLAIIGRFFSDRPRLKFSIKRVAQRAVANAILRELSFFWIKQDMTRAVPIIYSNFVGYDDVAHYSGPDTYEAQITLAAFDRRLRRLRRWARRSAPIGYDMVLLSDHGQTPSIPFRILAGQSIENTVADMLGKTRTLAQDPTRAFDPEASYSASLLAELEGAGFGKLSWAADRGRRALSRLTMIDRQDLGRAALEEVPTDSDGVVVCVSGSLAHIYFTGQKEPLHLEAICALYPGFTEQLARHPGIGFVAASRQFGDAVAMCDDGIRNLITGELGGDRDPMAPFGDADRMATELAQLIGYPDSGDLIINGSWLADQQRIVVLEEQTSSHGGFGGKQTEPFVLVPERWQVEASDLDSPEGLYRLFQRYRA